VWYAKYRLPDGRQRQRRVGPAWASRGRPQAGYFTKTMAERWLRDVLDEARRGTLSGMTNTGATFADAAAQYLRWVEHDRQRKPSTLRDYRQVIGNPKVSILQLKEWMGHADIDTTIRYLHFASRTDDAVLVADAFARRNADSPRHKAVLASHS
jgi:hypothetical protein